MSKNAAVTVRIPEAIKKRLAARAAREHRSLSAQMLHDLMQVAEEEHGESPGGNFLGRYQGAAIPSDRDIRLTRSLLWGRMGKSGRRSG